MSTARTNGKSEVKISPVCNKCRERHLKCDGGPQCSRCRQEGVLCQFRPSRRGMRPSSRRKSTPASDDGHSDAFLAAQTWVPSQSPMPAATNNAATLPCVYPVSRSQSGSPRQLPIPTDVFTYLTDLLYVNFYPDHQFVMPREHLVKELVAVEHCPLKAVIEYIGTFYDATFDRNGYRRRAEQLLSMQQYPSDGSLVQALLILAIGLNTDGYSTKADIVLQRAKKCAITIGMNDPAFSCLGPGGQIIQVENWRRTWPALRDFCQSWQAPSNLRATMPGLSRCTTVESTVGLEATVQFESSSDLTPFTAWKGFGAGPFTTGRMSNTRSNLNIRHDHTNREDDSMRVLDELLIEAGIYDGIELHNIDKHSTEWRNLQGSHGVA
jgi:Fungal Zn(2)-Cys(6) binuclear cluster domain